MYLIPCRGALEGVRLDLRVCLAPPAAFGNMGILNWEFWQFGNLETWTSGIWKSENLGSKQIQQWKSSKYVLPTMLARSGLVGKFLRPFFMPYQAISHGPTKTKKTCRNFDYLLWWAHRPYSPCLGCCCYPPLAGMYVLAE